MNLKKIVKPNLSNFLLSLFLSLLIWQAATTNEVGFKDTIIKNECGYSIGCGDHIIRKLNPVFWFPINFWVVGDNSKEKWNQWEERPVDLTSNYEMYFNTALNTDMQLYFAFMVGFPYWFIISYLVSCFIFFIYDKIKNKY